MNFFRRLAFCFIFLNDGEDLCIPNSFIASSSESSRASNNAFRVILPAFKESTFEKTKATIPSIASGEV
jgi:hypothetical protein